MCLTLPSSKPNFYFINLYLFMDGFFFFLNIGEVGLVGLAITHCQWKKNNIVVVDKNK